MALNLAAKSYAVEYDYDDVVVESDTEEGVVDLSIDECAVLKEEAVSAQRIWLMRNAASYVKGSPESAMADLSRDWTNEKMFRISALIDWQSGEPTEIVEAMQRGRVRARVSAAMGTGKSTFLPFYIAKKMDHRVLYIAPDVAAISQINKYVRSTGKGKFMRVWSEKVKEHVCCMTYADFCARESMTRRASLMKHFETIIFDEAFLKTPAICAALKIFAVVASPTVNLLLCSANIRTDSAGVEAMAAGAGNVRWLSKPVTPEQAMTSGKLVDEYLVDRTIVFLPNDERVGDMVAYYEANGVDVRALDSATHVQGSEKVEDWLDGDSVTPRVIVAHIRFAIAFNFKVAFVIVWPLVSEMRLVDNEITWVEVQAHISVVKQGLSRAGRDLVVGAGGMVMGPCREDDEEMCLMDKLEEFVLLHAANVKPLRNKYWEGCYAVFPDGMSPTTAQQIFKSNLPPYVAAKFLGSDGCFASKYSSAMMLFAQMGNYLIPSNDSEPVSSGAWEVVDVFEAKDKKCKIPVKCSGELLVVLQAIVLAAEGDVEMTRWQTETDMPYYDHSDFPGDIPESHDLQRKRLRRVRSFEKPEEKPASPTVEGWSYSATTLNAEMGGAGSRKGVLIPVDRFTDAVKTMRGHLVDYVVSPPAADVMETNGSVGEVELANLDGVVESPGGSVICTLPAKVCEMLNTGTPMKFEEFRHLVDAFREHGNRLVASRLFDAYSTPWSSFILSLHSNELVLKIVRSGLSPMAYNMLSLLYTRFSMELVATAKSSHILKKRFLGIFKTRPRADEVLDSMARGVFTDIAQSREFIKRVLEIKSWIDSAYVIGERNCVFLPAYVTEAQRALPIQGRSVLGSTASNMRRNPLSNNPMSRAYRPTSRDYDEWR